MVDSRRSCVCNSMKKAVAALVAKSEPSPRARERVRAHVSHSVCLSGEALLI